MDVILHRYLPDDARFLGVFNVRDATDFRTRGIVNAELGLLPLAAAARGDALLPAVHAGIFAPPVGRKEHNEPKKLAIGSIHRECTHQLMFR
jgi:hypothetical protein